MSTAGAGTAGHFYGEMFIAMAGIKPVVVPPYNGGEQAIDAVVDNNSQWTVAPIGGPPAACTAVESSRRLRSAARRGSSHCCRTCRPSPNPATPAMTRRRLSTGYVPNGTPQPIIDKLNATIAKAVDAAGGREAIRRAGHRGRQQHPGRDGEAACGGIRAAGRSGEKHRAQRGLTAAPTPLACANHAPCQRTARTAPDHRRRRRSNGPCRRLHSCCSPHPASTRGDLIGSTA